jgi:hypothetical protein
MPEEPPDSRGSPKLAVFEVVEVRYTPRARRDGIAGQTGAIVGMAEPDSPDGQITYAVQLINDSEIWSIAESDLIGTGRFANRDRFQSGESIRVSKEGDLLE